jgi:chromosome segregation ATPase
MALVDLIATGKEAEQLITDNGNLQNQLSTAALQHGNDQKEIESLRADVATVSEEVGVLSAQISQLQSTVTYADLESNPWKANTDKSVGGSGLGTGGWKAPSVECAELVDS